MNILLVHGLGRTPISMFSLARSLRAARHRTAFFAYTPTFESLPDIVRRLVARIKRLARLGEPLGVVGHSLGGLLLRLALEQAPELCVHHLVMLGTPNQPPRIARFAWRFRLFRMLTRDCGRLLASVDAIAKIPVPRVPYALIAGTAGPHYIWHEPNDGIVAVSEVLIAKGDMPHLVPVWHSFLMNNQTVQAIVSATMMTTNPHAAPKREHPCPAPKTSSADH